MSRFFTDRLSNLVPYVPGEQPQDKQYIKLNTNESPFPPSPGVSEAVHSEIANLRLYSDPDCTALRAKMAESFGVDPEWVIISNGSDEILNFAFMAFADDKNPLAFPDITYGFYTVFADVNHIPYEEIPLMSDFSINPEDYTGLNKTIVIANPNAPTGRYLPLCDVEKILQSNPDNIVIIDEAYIDFGGESAISLVKQYSNLFVTGTFSKSRSMAGIRLGFGIANPELIADINMIKYSTNPYNVDRLACAAGLAALEEQSYYDANCAVIIENRKWTENALKELGFEIIPSKTNFVFAKNDEIDGEKLYLSLKEKGVLIRHFNKERTKEYIRITIGTMEQMQILIQKIIEIKKEIKK